MSIDSAEALPSGWVRATIEDLVGKDGVFCDGDWVESKDQDPEGDVRLIQLADVGDGVYVNRSSRFLTSEKARELRCTFLQPGDVLVARMPDPLGRACQFPGDRRRSVTVVDVAIIRTGNAGADHRWLMWFVNSPDFRRAVADLQSGSTRKRISRRNLASISLPVPSLPEQRRIADAVEAELSRLDAGVKALRRVQANLKRYRAAVLKAACEGRLVPTEAELARQEGRDYEPADVLLDRILAARRARWEAEEIAQTGKKPTGDVWKRGYVEPEWPSGLHMPVIPQGWVYATLDQLLITGLSNGRSVPTASSGFPVLRLTALGNGRIDLREHKIGAWTIEEAQSFLVSEGDFLVARGNGSKSLVGRGGLVGPVAVPIAYPDTLIRIRVATDVLLRNYLRYIWDSQAVRDQIESAARTTAGIYKINQQDLRRIVLPLPPISEQTRIVAELDRRISVAYGAEAIVEKGLRRADRLRQSILKRAFEGKLVPQDPNDEPASALLERIRATREAAPKPKKRTTATGARGRTGG